MWSHYGGQHYGICIGFDDKESGVKLSNPDSCIKVRYSDELPKMSDGGFQTELGMSMGKDGQLKNSHFQLSFTDSTLQKIISTKPKSWEYENEWRYVEPFGGAYDWPSKIKEIVFGLKCPEERREYYVSLANRNVPNEVFLYEMVKKEGGNEVVKVPYSTPKTTPAFTLDKRESTNEHGETVHVLSAEQFSYAVEELFKQGDFDYALFQVERALEEAESADQAHLISLKARALGFKGLHEEALSEFRKLDKLCPNDPIILYQISCALDACGLASEALAALKEANLLPHEDASIPYNIGVTTLKLGGDDNEALPYLIMARTLKHPKADKLIKALQK
nr:DUF2971 domain-containing protein [Vibrio sp. L3-7]